MLSYQHIFHAGNLADVQKHALMCSMLDYLTAKPKPISYLETHSGRGLYFLDTDEALKTGEAAGGITRVQDWFSPDHPYARALAAVRDDYGDAAYPGSPMLAARLLRDTDSLHLGELHPQEGQALENVLGHRAKVHRQDGFQMAQAVCPPEPRRGVMLIDPSYEVKADYDRIPAFIAKIHRKWNVAVIALWYPILTSQLHTNMLVALEAQGLPKTLRHEVRFPPVREGHRMVGSGMFIVNTPYGLETEADRLSKKFAML
ncbi:MAG: 23S rRNA (adenine(2030)-N(6))-methyltransferase RlmJ [Rhodobacteraceae bacterium]|nr:23S rRNA (adenine(2030)-N(6))-methyltransferase RlmJ [Paracoccaceae bacterium]